MITGATGKQGKAVVDALLAQPSSPFNILAVTRSASSPTAQKLASRSSRIKIVEGTLDDCETLLNNAEAASPNGKIYGVYSVQISMVSSETTLSSRIKLRDVAKRNCKYVLTH